MDQYIFLIPLLPLLGFLFNFTVGVRLLTRKAAHGHDDHGGHGHGEAHHAPSPIVGLVACGSVGLAFLLSAAAVLAARTAPDHTLVQTLWTWIPGGAAETLIGGKPGASPFQVDWAYQVDPLSSVMILVVTFVGFLIHVYSTGYMSHDAGYARYMSYLNLFMFAMLTLVLGANYAVLFVGWEGVGLCSYLLIGFWFHKDSAADAGKKAFIVNRIGDAGFVLGMFLIWTTVGSVDFRTVAKAVALMPVEQAWTGTLTMVALFLFVGACGKSAQIPLYVWLPDAMEGPTPVSALIHAATMVTAGVYMVARSSAIYAHAPNAMMVVAVVGAATAFFAASIGLAQYDIKRVLAYSTVSQLGYMFLACGVGAFTAAVFHLATHAFFKALLFLGSGSVIHGMSGEQDMRKMGGLRSKMPTTHLTMWIACFAIAGIFPLSGFFSKDEILWSAFKIGGYGRLVWAVGAVTAAMTAFYMFRLYHMTFSGSFRGGHDAEHHVHESPASMTIPLQVLMVGSVIAGFVGVPHVLGQFVGVGNGIEHFLEPVFASANETMKATVLAHTAHGTGLELGLMAGSLGLAGVSILFAYRMYKADAAAADARLAASFGGLHRLLLNKYYVDELYGALFVRGAALGGGNGLWAVDRYGIDGGDGQVRPGLGVNGVAWACRDILAKLSDLWDQWIVDGILCKLTDHVFDNLSYVFRAVQNGLVQHYALTMLIAVLFMIGIGSWYVL